MTIIEETIMTIIKLDPMRKGVFTQRSIIWVFYKYWYPLILSVHLHLAVTLISSLHGAFYQ